MAKGLKLAVIPELTLLVEVDGEPAGCAVALPDLNQELHRLRGRLTPWGLLRLLTHRRRATMARVTLAGVKKRYRRLGIDLLLYTEIWKQAAKRGIGHGEAAWLLEDNTLIIRAMEALGGVVNKRYRLYQKALV
jgi:ribosomal protein S18 acetylase RimI-like enzyme